MSLARWQAFVFKGPHRPGKNRKVSYVSHRPGKNRKVKMNEAFLIKVGDR